MVALWSGPKGLPDKVGGTWNCFLMVTSQDEHLRPCGVHSPQSSAEWGNSGAWTGQVEVAGSTCAVWHPENLGRPLRLFAASWKESVHREA